MQRKESVIFMILAAVIMIWGLNVVMIKYLAFFPPVLIAAIRMTVAALVLLPIMFWKEGRVSLAPREWIFVGIVGLTSIALHQILVAWGVTFTTAGNTSLILSLNPLATSLLALPFLGEPLTKRKLTGIALGFSGVLVVVVSTAKTGISWSGWGDVLVFGSMLMYVIGGLFIRKATSRGVPVLVMTAYSHMIGSILLWLLAFFIYPIEVIASIDTAPFTWLVILTSGVLATAIGTVGWNYGIQQLGASRTAIFLNGMPLASLVFAAVLLGEKLQILHALSFVLILTGVYLGQDKTKYQKVSPSMNSVGKAL